MYNKLKTILSQFRIAPFYFIKSFLFREISRSKIVIQNIYPSETFRTFDLALEIDLCNLRFIDK